MSRERKKGPRDFVVMPDQEKKPEAAGGEAQDGGKNKKSIVTFGIFGGVMLVEGLAIFFCMRFLGSSPDPTIALEQLNVPASQPWTESHEIEVARLRVQNVTESRTTIYNVTVAVLVHQSNAEDVQTFLEARKNTIDDALGRIIRSTDNKHLTEPGLETLKRQFKYELDKLIGSEDMIEEVLIPDCMPLQTGY